MNNEIFHITHLSADKLSCLNCLPVKSLAFDFFLSSNFAFPRPKNQNLKKSSKSRNKRLQMSGTCIASCRQSVVASCL